MDYVTLKAVHVSSVAASYALFFVRGVWMMRQPEMLSRGWVKVVPHVIDTMLLASAITMALMIRQYPFAVGWLTAKVLGLVGYIGLGMLALKHGRSLAVRVAAWIAAQGVFAYIVAVAVWKRPVPWL